MSAAQNEIDAAEAQMEACPCTTDEWTQRICSGEYDPDKAHASTWVCDRPAHVAAASTWVTALTGVQPQRVRKEGAPELLFPDFV